MPRSDNGRECVASRDTSDARNYRRQPGSTKLHAAPMQHKAFCTCIKCTCETGEPDQRNRAGMGARNTRTGSDHHQDQTLIDGCRITCFFQPRPARHTLAARPRPRRAWLDLHRRQRDVAVLAMARDAAVERVLLIAASVLSAGSGLVLLFWAADAVRERS